MSETLLDLNVGMNADFSGIGKSMDSAASISEAGMNRMYQAALRFMGAAGVSGVFWKAAQSFQQFSQVVADISSITSNNIEDIEKKLLKLNNVLGAPDKLGDIFYETISSGIRGANQELTDFVETSAKTATVIRADAFTTSSALTTMMNAYGKSAKDAAELLDFFYVTVREGKAHGDELARTMGLAVNNAAESGVSINEFGAAIATLSRTMTTSNALISINQMMNSFLGPTAEATAEAKKYGIELSMEAVRAKGFAGVLKEMHERVGGNTAAIRRMFGELRAARGAFALTGNQFESFMEIMNEMELKAGTGEEAFKKQAATVKMAYQSMLNQSEKAAIQMGKDNEGLIRTIYGVAEATTKAFEDTDPLVRYTIYVFAIVKAFQALKAELANLGKIHNNLINPSASAIGGGKVSGSAAAGKLANINGEQLTKTSAEFGAVVEDLIMNLKRSLVVLTQAVKRTDALAKESMNLKMAFDEMLTSLKAITADFSAAVRSVNAFAKAASDFIIKAENLKSSMLSLNGSISKASSDFDKVITLAKGISAAANSMAKSFDAISKVEMKITAALTGSVQTAEGVALQAKQIESGYATLGRINTKIINSLNRVASKYQEVMSPTLDAKGKAVTPNLTPTVIRQEQATKLLVSELSKQTVAQSQATAEAAKNIKNLAVTSAATTTAMANLDTNTAKNIAEAMMRNGAYSGYLGSSAEAIDRKIRRFNSAPTYLAPSSPVNGGVARAMQETMQRFISNEIASGTAYRTFPAYHNYNPQDINTEVEQERLARRLAYSQNAPNRESTFQDKVNPRLAVFNDRSRAYTDAIQKQIERLNNGSTHLDRFNNATRDAIGATYKFTKKMVLTGSSDFGKLGTWAKDRATGLGAGLDKTVGMVGNAGMALFGGISAAELGWGIGKAIAEKFEFDKSNWMEVLRSALDGGNAKIAELQVEGDLANTTRKYVFGMLKRIDVQEKFTEGEIRQFALQLSEATTQNQIIGIRKRLSEQLEARLNDGDKRRLDEKTSEEALLKAREKYAKFLRNKSEGNLPLLLGANQLSKASEYLGDFSVDAKRIASGALLRDSKSKAADQLRGVIEAEFASRYNRMSGDAQSGYTNNLVANTVRGSDIKKSLGQDYIEAGESLKAYLSGNLSQDDFNKIGGFKRKLIEVMLTSIGITLETGEQQIESEDKRLQSEVTQAARNKARTKANTRIAELDKLASGQMLESDVKQARVFVDKSGRGFEFDKDVTLGAKLSDTANTYNAYMEQLKGQFQVLDVITQEFNGASQDEIEANTAFIKTKIAETKKHINEAQNVIVDTTAKIVDQMVKGFEKDLDKSVTGIDTESMTSTAYEQLQKALIANQNTMITERAKQIEKLKGSDRQEDIKAATDSIDALDKMIKKRADSYIKALQNQLGLRVAEANSRAELNRMDYEMGTTTSSDFNTRQLNILRDVVIAEKDKLKSMKEGTAEYYNQLVAVKRAETNVNSFAKSMEDAGSRIQSNLLKGMLDFTSGKDAKDKKGNLTNDSLYHTVNLMSRALGPNPFGSGGAGMTENNGTGFPSMKNTQEAQSKVARTLDAYIASQSYAEASTGKTVQNIYAYLKSSGTIVVK